MVLTVILRRAPTARCVGDQQAHAAVFGEFEGIGEEVLQHLLHTFGIGDDAAGKVGIEINVEREVSTFGLVPERPGDGLDQVGEVDLLGIDRDGAGFDLR